MYVYVCVYVYKHIRILEYIIYTISMRTHWSHKLFEVRDIASTSEWHGATEYLPHSIVIQNRTAYVWRSIIQQTDAIL